MGIYDNAVKTAKRLIHRYGQSVTWRQPAATTPGNTPWKPTAAAPTDETVKIVFLPKTGDSKELLRYLAGTEITIGSLQGLMPVTDFEPDLNDVVLRDGKELRIKAITPLSPGGVIIFYTIEFDV